MFHHNLYYIVRDSKNKLYKIYIEQEMLMIEGEKCCKEESPFILRDVVTLLTVEIDTQDIVHIVYKEKQGTLKYIEYYPDSIIKEITSIDYKENSSTIEAKWVQGVLHLFYIFITKSEKIQRIIHDYYYNGEWVSGEIAKVHCDKYVIPYHISVWKEQLYILYCKVSSKEEYGLKKFHLINKVWEDEKKILFHGANNIRFLICSNKAVFCYSKTVCGNMQIFIRFSALEPRRKVGEVEVPISAKGGTSFKPLLFYKEPYIYVSWKSKKNIIYRKSIDLLQWSEEKEYSISQEGAERFIYRESQEKQKNSDQYVPVFLIKEECSRIQDILHSPSTTIERHPIKEAEVGFTIEKSEEENAMERIDIWQEKFYVFQEENFHLKKHIKTLEKTIAQYKMRLAEWEQEKKVYEKAQEEETRYKEEILNLRQQNEEIRMNANNQICSLLKIMKEKEESILKLYDLLKKIKQELQ